jgi:hypothetical protein
MDVEHNPVYWAEYYFRTHVLKRLDALEQQIKESPRAVKPTGGNTIHLCNTGLCDENLSLRNLAARESECPRCFPGRPGQELVDCDGSAGFKPCTGCWKID